MQAAPVDPAGSDPRPIGVFDSGWGGLSVLRHLAADLPGERFVYLADHAGLPYGGRTAADIAGRMRRLTGLMIDRHDVKMVVVACNTATAAGIDELRSAVDLPIVGTEPPIRPAVAATASGVVGVMATAATLAQPRFARLLGVHANGVRVLTQACPGLVEQVELGNFDGDDVRAMVGGYVMPLVAAGADVIALGCTHYPFLAPLIAEAAGNAVTLIEPGIAVARRVASLIGPSARPGTAPEIRFLTTGDPAVAAAGSRLWGHPIAVSSVDISGPGTASPPSAGGGFATRSPSTG